MNYKYEIAAYYVPVFHPDDKQQEWHGKGWTEWELIKRAEPRFEGHQQPKLPLWGFEDESNPIVMEKKIDAAADYGLSALIFDWYWYDNGPFLQRCLDEGFLRAKNVNKIKFALMWANHDWYDWHPGKRNGYNKKYMDGAVSPDIFKDATDHMINTYFAHPNYWRVNKGLYFSIYELGTLIAGLGGVENASNVLKDFRARVRAAGLGELHLNVIVTGVSVLPGETNVENENNVLKKLGFDSVTTYTWLHHIPMNSFPTVFYNAYSELSIKDYENKAIKYELPYYPNITMGWDPSPRTVQSEVYGNFGYPFTPILSGNTPIEFKNALEKAKTYLNSSGLLTKILTINAWNEWSEGSYLEPDTLNGMSYLEAVRDVFA